VETGTVPVARDGLRREGHLYAKLFSDAVEDKSGHPELIAHYLRN